MIRTAYGYLLKQWLFTVLFGPLIGFALYSQYAAIVEGEVLCAIFGLFYSTPPLLGCLILIHGLRRTNLSAFWMKIILLVAALLGIVITLGLTDGTMVTMLIAGYSLAAMISSLIFKLRWESS